MSDVPMYLSEESKKEFLAAAEVVQKFIKTRNPYFEVRIDSLEIELTERSTIVFDKKESV